MQFADLELARRLETTDALAGVEFARSWANQNLFTGSVFLPVAGGHAHDEHTFGLGPGGSRRQVK